MGDDLKDRIKREENEQIKFLESRLLGKNQEQQRMYLTGYLDSIEYHLDHGIGMELAQTPKYSKYLITMLTGLGMREEANSLRKHLKSAIETFKVWDMVMENLTE